MNPITIAVAHAFRESRPAPGPFNGRLSQWGTDLHAVQLSLSLHDPRFDAAAFLEIVEGK